MNPIPLTSVNVAPLSRKNSAFLRHRKGLRTALEHGRGPDGAASLPRASSAVLLRSCAAPFVATEEQLQGDLGVVDAVLCLFYSSVVLGLLLIAEWRIRLLIPWSRERKQWYLWVIQLSNSRHFWVAMLAVLATAKILYSAAVSNYCSDKSQNAVVKRTAIGDVSHKNKVK